jgi:hypothetical protein
MIILTRYSRKKEYILAQNKAWNAAHKDKMNEYARRYREKNKKKISESQYLYRLEHPKEYKAKYKRWAKKHWLDYYAKNKDKIIQRVRNNELRLKETNPEKYRAIKKESNLRHRSVPRNRLSNNIGKAIWQSLKDRKNGCHWETLVDFTLDQLIVHLEKKFKPGMSWENRSLWHIDHIIPVSVFNIVNDKSPDFKKCWCLKNLQPLWKEENLRKNAKLNKPFQPSLSI